MATHQNNLLKLYFKEMLVLYPTFATFLGDKTKHDKVEISISPQHLKAYKALLLKYKIKLKHSQQTLDNKLLKNYININLKLLRYPFYLTPITSYSNPILEFSFMESTFYSNSNKKAQTKRYNQYTEYLKQAKLNMVKGISQNYTIPKRICEKAIIDIKNYITTPEFKDLPYVAYKTQIQSLLNFMENTYLPHCRTTISISDLPNSKTLYKDLIEHQTSLKLKPEEIFEYGKTEVKRIQSELLKLAPKLYPNNPPKTLQEFTKKMKEDPNHYFKTKAQVLEAYKQKRIQIATTIIPRFFYKQVEPYDIKTTPKHLEASSPGAYYYPGIKTRKGVFYINLRSVEENPKYIIDTLSMHEGVPGHHYQYQYMLEQNIPDYRKFASDNNSYSEGWALYAESLSTSTDPIDQFGRLTYELFRAIRCVVDPGIHYYGWSFERTLKYMTNNVAMQESELLTEIERYICNPAQAVTYKIGERFFKEERDRYLKNHPDKTIKDYHKEVLEHGNIDLSLLRDLIS